MTVPNTVKGTVWLFLEFWVERDTSDTSDMDEAKKNQKTQYPLSILKPLFMRRFFFFLLLGFNFWCSPIARKCGREFISVICFEGRKAVSHTQRDEEKGSDRDTDRNNDMLPCQHIDSFAKYLKRNLYLLVVKVLRILITEEKKKQQQKTH